MLNGSGSAVTTAACRSTDNLVSNAGRCEMGVPGSHGSVRKGDAVEHAMRRAVDMVEERLGMMDDRRDGFVRDSRGSRR